MKTRTKVSIVAALVIVIMTFGNITSVINSINDSGIGYSLTNDKLVEGDNDWTRKS